MKILLQIIMMENLFRERMAITRLNSKMGMFMSGNGETIKEMAMVS